MNFDWRAAAEQAWAYVYDGASDILMRAWNEGLFGASYEQLMYAAGILLIALLLRGLFARWVIGMIRAVVKGTSTRIDDAIVDALCEPMKLIFVIIGVAAAIRVLNLAEDAQIIADRVVRSLIAIAFFWSLHRLASALRIVMAPLAEVLTASAVEWLVKALQVIFLIVGAAAVLEIWGIRVAPLLAGLGIFGVAVALGAQDLFKNLIAGFAVIAERRFQKGDWVLVDGVVEGTVEEINFRSTVVRRFDKGPVYVPNAKFADNAVVNFSRMSHRRIYWHVGVEYGATVAQLRNIRDRIEQYLIDNEAFADPPEVSRFVHVDCFSDSSIDYMIYCFTKTTDWGAWLKLKEDFALAIKEIVESEGAAFAFPSRTLYFAGGQDTPEKFEPPAKAA